MQYLFIHFPEGRCDFPTRQKPIRTESSHQTTVLFSFSRARGHQRQAESGERSHSDPTAPPVYRGLRTIPHPGTVHPSHESSKEAALSLVRLLGPGQQLGGW